MSNESAKLRKWVKNLSGSDESHGFIKLWCGSEIWIRSKTLRGMVCPCTNLNYFSQMFIFSFKKHSKTSVKSSRIVSDIKFENRLISDISEDGFLNHWWETN